MSQLANPVVVATSHVGINVVDLDRSVAFYAAVLGLGVGHRSTELSKRFAFLTAGGETVVTLWEQAEARCDTTRAGLHHLAFRFPTTEALVAAERTIRSIGVKVYYNGVVAQGEGSGALFFEDPDGTRLEIAAPYSDAPESPSDGPPCGFF
jgi:lactoylglutathione lyase